MNSVLPIAYLPPVSYFAEYIRHANVLIESMEHFPKQTLRNRCSVLGANGPITLIIPVEKGRSGKTPVKDIRIAHRDNWQRNHWRTILSAYKNAPFFEYYEHLFSPVFEKKHDWLMEFDLELLQVLDKCLNLKKNFQLSSAYIESYPSDFTDFRGKSFNENDPESFPEYTQVFSDRHPFIHNLSVIDLLFNNGPESVNYLMHLS